MPEDTHHGGLFLMSGRYGKDSFINMDKSLFEPKRKSHIDRDEIYFWTATINNWQHLLESDKYKNVIIDSLQYLSDTRKIDVFGFVIMPNHIHLIWRINESNGKESPQGSFLKYTAHILKKCCEKKVVINYQPLL